MKYIHLIFKLSLILFSQNLTVTASIVPVENQTRPNIILVMADDLGWGDVAYNGNPTVLTPELDRMAEEGIRLDRFYAGAPVCTPTRASVLTGRNAYRSGVIWAGEYPLPSSEKTLAEALKEDGYDTGFFGKWHLGTMTKTEKDGYLGGPDHPEAYGPPWEHGFDTSFATEINVPTYNPQVWPYEWSKKSDRENVYIMQRPIKKGEGTVMQTSGQDRMKKWKRPLLVRPLE